VSIRSTLQAKVGDGISIKTVTESTKAHIFLIVTDSMCAEASKLQTQEKNIMTRAGKRIMVDIYSVAITNNVEQEDYVSCFLCGKIGESRA
jgi:hypothetical protein